MHVLPSSVCHDAYARVMFLDDGSCSEFNCDQIISQSLNPQVAGHVLFLMADVLLGLGFVPQQHFLPVLETSLAWTFLAPAPLSIPAASSLSMDDLRALPHSSHASSSSQVACKHQAGGNLLSHCHLHFPFLL